jgi:hypothetical protein
MAKKKRAEMTPTEIIYIREKDRLWYMRTNEWRSKPENRAKKASYNLEYRNRPGIKEKLSNQNKVWRESTRGKEYRIAYEMNLYYKISQVEFYDKWISQNGKCAICRKDLPGRRDAFVDHDHHAKKSCGVRDLLCKHCNSILGLSKESPAILRAAALYIEQWNSVFHARGVKNERETTTNPVLVCN